MKINRITNEHSVNFGTKLPRKTNPIYVQDRSSYTPQFVAQDYWPDFVQACVRNGYTDKLEELLEKISRNNRDDVLGLECVKKTQGSFSYNHRAGAMQCETPHEMNIFFTLKEDTESLEESREKNKYPIRVLCASPSDSVFVNAMPPECNSTICKQILQKLEQISESDILKKEDKAAAILKKYREA